MHETNNMDSRSRQISWLKKKFGFCRANGSPKLIRVSFTHWAEVRARKHRQYQTFITQQYNLSLCLLVHFRKKKKNTPRTANHSFRQFSPQLILYKKSFGNKFSPSSLQPLCLFLLLLIHAYVKKQV